MPRNSRRTYREVVLNGLDPTENGVTVVMASYRAPAEAIESLESLTNQTLDPSQFEVVLVVNGAQADDVSAFEDFRAAHPRLRLRILRTGLAGACHALNLGIQAARMNWTTFVDDDDHVSPRFLEGLLAVAGPGLIPLTVINDVHPDGSIRSDNRINQQIGPLTGFVVPPEDCPRGLSFNASKLVPTDWARAVLYDTHLASGQDIAFYGGLYARYDFDFAVVPAALESVYYRALSETSQSRRDLTFGFAIQERLEVIHSLARRLGATRPAKQPVIKSMMRSQALFMRRYLESHPEDRTRVNSTIQAAMIEQFPWDVLTEREARKLVVSVCFPPYSDASAVTVAKRIVEAGDVVDVISADMSGLRPHDPSLNLLVTGLVGSHTTLSTRMSFSDWSSARNFCLEGWRSLERPRGRRRWPYDAIYSRAMWPASHILAALIKVRRSATRWTAEFSDPLSRTVEGSVRLGSYQDDELTSELLHGARQASGISLPAPTSLFELAEVLPFALADELVFTNRHQLEYMVDYWASTALADIVRSKATISPHPVPPPDFYRLVEAEPLPASGRIRLAYFGSFYANRSLGDVFTAITRQPLDIRRNLAFDIYTSDRSALRRAISEMNLFDVVTILDPVPYLTFLNLTTDYDVLVVNDTSTAGSHANNPYLPSKWSDYRGSGSSIWALVEEGSTMSLLDAEFSSRAGNVDDAAATLRAIADARRDERASIPSALLTGSK